MVEITKGEALMQACPEAKLGALQCRVVVTEEENEFRGIFNEKIAELAEVELSMANKREKIQSTRKAYKALGKDPTRYRCSAEAMCRRIAKDRGLYYINNVVDINNYLSIKSGYSMGTYDLSKVTGPIVWDRAPEGTAYQGIGKDVLNIEFLPALFEEGQAFGNPTSDSTRAMITPETKEIILLYYAFDEGEELGALLQEAQELLAMYAGGTDFEVRMI